MTNFTLKLKLKDATFENISDEEKQRNHNKWIAIRKTLTKHYKYDIKAKDLCDNTNIAQIAQADTRINLNAILALIVLERCLNNTDEIDSALILRRKNDILNVTVAIDTDISSLRIQRILNTISEMVIDGTTDVFVNKEEVLQLYFDKNKCLFKPRCTISAQRLLYLYQKAINHIIEPIDDDKIIYNDLKNIGMTDNEITMFGYMDTQT